MLWHSWLAAGRAWQLVRWSVRWSNFGAVLGRKELDTTADSVLAHQSGRNRLREFIRESGSALSVDAGIELASCDAGLLCYELRDRWPVLARQASASRRTRRGLEDLERVAESCSPARRHGPALFPESYR